MNEITVVLVDDHRVVTRSLQSYLESFAETLLAAIRAVARGRTYVDAWPRGASRRTACHPTI